MEWTNPGNNRVRHQTSPQATLLQRDAQLQSGGLLVNSPAWRSDCRPVDSD